METREHKFKSKPDSTHPFAALIIEADPSVSALLRKIFNHCSHKADFVLTFQEGISQSGKRGYDLVMLDIRDGDDQVAERISELRRRYPGAEIITMTTDNPKEMEMKVREQKVTYHLIKPFKSLEIMSLVYHFAMRKNNLLSAYSN